MKKNKPWSVLESRFLFSRHSISASFCSMCLLSASRLSCIHLLHSSFSFCAGSLVTGPTRPSRLKTKTLILATDKSFPKKNGKINLHCTCRALSWFPFRQLWISPFVFRLYGDILSVVPHRWSLCLLARPEKHMFQSDRKIISRGQCNFHAPCLPDAIYAFTEKQQASVAKHHQLATSLRLTPNLNSVFSLKL